MKMTKIGKVIWKECGNFVKYVEKFINSFGMGKQFRYKMNLER